MEPIFSAGHSGPARTQWVARRTSGVGEQVGHELVQVLPVDEHGVDIGEFEIDGEEPITGLVEDEVQDASSSIGRIS